jgi:hypothetical protein
MPSLALVAAQMVPKVGHVSQRHPLDPEQFLVGGAEPPGELPQVAHQRLAGGRREVVRCKEVSKQGRLPLPDRDTVEMLISPILHGIAPKSGRKVNGERGLLGG